ncbi:MAG: hypothetical protein AAF630_20330 [Cyanobacteria bacterium P01_C01_bin.38]
MHHSQQAKRNPVSIRENTNTSLFNRQETGFLKLNFSVVKQLSKEVITALIYQPKEVIPSKAGYNRKIGKQGDKENLNL